MYNDFRHRGQYNSSFRLNQLDGLYQHKVVSVCVQGKLVVNDTDDSAGITEYNVSMAGENGPRA